MKNFLTQFFFALPIFFWMPTFFQFGVFWKKFSETSQVY
uniref:Uncharacterized protein n=1 Tax=viral metagenome TaxID=1070528 RepID=A0A6C0BNZ8_9ZZZZ